MTMGFKVNFLHGEGDYHDTRYQTPGIAKFCSVWHMHVLAHIEHSRRNEVLQSEGI
jgi:hypothetical protein